MFDPIDLTTSTITLELLVRTALTHGELTPGAERAVQHLCYQGNLTFKEQRLLAILQDAIAEGCVQCSSSP